jgi:anion-transporting  ArsA/GET3 family ATPase
VQVGPINTQAQEVVELLSDPKRAQVVLVALPEETPVNELVETAFHLEDRVGVSLGPVVVNGIYPELDGLEIDPVQAAADAGTTLRDGEAEALKSAAEFRLQRTALQREQLARLADALPLPQLHLPFLFKADLDADDLRMLASTLRDGVERLP